MSEGSLRVGPSQFLVELNERIERGSELLNAHIDSQSQLKDVRDSYYTWDEYNTQLLRRRFSSEELVRKYVNSIFFGVAYERSLAEQVVELHEDIQSKIRRLRSIAEQVPLLELDASVVTAMSMESTPSIVESEPSGIEIFVVHGRNDAVKLEVTDFVERLVERRPVILHEHASEGRTLIEKLEHYGNSAGFAIVILTGDDEGRMRGSEDLALPRGRQNVVLELGYFMARLGRSRVILLYESDVELPSDMTGIVYTRLDAGGGWKLTLAKELKAAGISIDVNRAI